jgi:hypothetical protein
LIIKTNLSKSNVVGAAVCVYALCRCTRVRYLQNHKGDLESEGGERKLQIRENGLLSVKGVDNEKIAIYHVIVVLFIVQFLSLLVRVMAHVPQ